MPITPHFELSQDSDFVTLEINVPYVRVTDAEIYIEGRDVAFYCKPYLLKLTLPHPVLENEKTKSVYDMEKNNGTVVLSLPKETPGQHFENLDMIQTLMQPKAQRPSRSAVPSSTSSGPEKTLLERVSELAAQEPTPGPAASGRPLIEVVEDSAGQGSVNEPGTLEEEQPQEEQTEESKGNLSSESDPPFRRVNEGRLMELLRMADQEDEQQESGAASKPLIQEVDGTGQQAQASTSSAAKEETGTIRPKASLLDKDLGTSSAVEAKEDPVQAVLASSDLHYGFNRGYSGVFRYAEISAQILEVSDPEHRPLSERKALRKQTEDVKFSEERYAGDFLEGEDDPLYQAAMALTPAWIREAKRRRVRLKETRSDAVEKASSSDALTEGHPLLKYCSLKYAPATGKEDEETFSGLKSSEMKVLRDLPNREFLPFSATEQNRIAALLVSTLIAAAYDSRMTEEEGNVESGWTLSSLIPQLTWLDEFDGIEDAATARRWDLAELCVADAAIMLSQGRRVCLRQLLKVHQAFAKDEQRYLFNTIAINDLIVWIQKVPFEVLQAYARQATKFAATMNERVCRWDLKAIEAWAWEQVADGNEGGEDTK